MAVPTLVSAGTATAGGPFTSATVTPALPTGLVDGDVVVCLATWWNRQGATGTVIEQTWVGWTERYYEVFNPTGSLGDLAVAIFTATYSVTLGLPVLRFTGGSATGSTYVAQTIGVRGVDPLDPIDVLGTTVQTDASLTSFVVPGITTGGIDRFWLLWLGKSSQASGMGVTGAGGAASLVSTLNTAAGNDAFHAVLRGSLASAGAVGPHTITVSATPAGQWFGKTLALNPVTDVQTLNGVLIPSEEAFPTGVVTGVDDQVLTGTLIASAEAFYVGVVGGYLAGELITSAEEFFLGTVTAANPEVPDGLDEGALLQRFSADVFPPGTVVGVYPETRAGIDRAPIGQPLATETANELGQFTASGLSVGKFYVAYAVVDGKHRYLRFRYEVSPA